MMDKELNMRAARPEAMQLVKDMAQAVQERNADQYQSAADRYATGTILFAVLIS